MRIKYCLKIFVLLTVFVLVSVSKSFAVCPACIVGAGFGVVNAFTHKDMYKLGFWLAGFMYLTVKYLQTRFVSRKYGSVESIVPALLLPVPLFFFITGIAVLLRLNEIPSLSDSISRNLFLMGSLLGTFVSFIGTVGVCVIKVKYNIKIPFFRIISILTLLWLVSLI